MDPMSEGRLDSWKEIAAYLGRDESTVRRWERTEGLPVHRHRHLTRSSVYAFPGELDEWRANRKPLADVPVRPAPRPALRALALALGLACTVISPGGGRALGSARVSGASTFTEVWELPRGSQIIGTVSNDGRLLAHLRWREARRGADLLVRDLSRGTDRSLAPGADNGSARDGAFAPDGRSLAVGWVTDGRADVRLIGIESAALRPIRTLYSNPEIAEISVKDWSRDDASIAVTLRRQDRTSQIALIGVGDGRMRVLRSIDWRQPSRVAFSPDGRFLAFDLPAAESLDQRDIVVLSVDATRQVTAVGFPSHETLVGWAPDGRRLLFTSDRSGEPGLWAVGWADGNTRGEPELVSGGFGGLVLGVADDRSIPYIRTAPAFHGTAFDLRVAAYDFNGERFLQPPATAVQRFVGSNGSPEWSADGRELAYVSDRSDGDVIVVQSRETGEVVRTVRPGIRLYSAARDAWIRWSPDGRLFAAQGTDSKGRSGIHLLDATTGAASPLALTEQPDEVKRLPAWSRDGSKIYYQHRAFGGPGAGPKRDETRDAIVEIDLASRRERTIIRRAAFWDFWLAPDGERLVVRSWDFTTSTPVPVLLLVPVTGKPVTELRRAQPDGQIGVWNWAPDSRSVYVTESGSLIRVPIEGGGQATPVPLGLDASFGAPRLSPDGRHLAFMVTQPTRPSAVWVLRDALREP
jgi:Tol biopolymer transport system component